MDEWIPNPNNNEAFGSLGTALATALREQVPTTVEAAAQALQKLYEQVMEAENDKEIRDYQARMVYFKQLFRDHQEIRQQAEIGFLTGEWRIGHALLADDQEGSARGRPPENGDPGSRISRPPSLTDKVGNRRYGWRLKALAGLDLEALESYIHEFHRAGREATLTGISKLLNAGKSATRRMNSLTAPRIPNGMDLRIGDCRVVLADIPDESVPLIMTDPPYGEAAEPLYRWLAAFAARVLIPGGSLICYTGQAMLPRDMAIFSAQEGLNYWWQAIMLHDQSQRLAGKFVIPGYKPILWYVKGHRHSRTLVPDVLTAVRDKSDHSWAQGDGGVRVWLHHLTEPEETVVDPFAGTAAWGRIACEEGRYWIGSDIAFGGTTTICAHDIDVADTEED